MPLSFLIPTPKKTTYFEGNITMGEVCFILPADCDSRIINETERIKSTFGSDTKGNVQTDIEIEYDKSEKEGYTLTVRNDKITVYGDGLNGAFYGLQTLKQILTCLKDKIPCCVIEDSPDFSYRAFYHDITRGRVPRLKTLKELADNLAFYKQNSLQLYVEHCFPFKEYDGIYQKYGYITAEEITELDKYCRERFIDFVPSLSTFGHLYELLQDERYSHLCELENYKPSSHYWIERMKHHTVDASNPESFELIKSLLDQYIPLFSSDKFNICCDETFDLATGRNKGKDKAELYLMFVTKIINYVKSKGKKVMLWGDIVLKHPELLKNMPEEVIYLNWNYDANPSKEQVEAFKNVNKTQIICPGVSAWNRIIEDINVSIPNISKTVTWGYENGAAGIMNTNWGDGGNICSIYLSMYGMIAAAQKSWNINGDIQNDNFKNAVSRLYYGDESLFAPQALSRLAKYQYCHIWNNTNSFYSYLLYGSSHYIGKATAEMIKESYEGTKEIEDILKNSKWKNENCRKNMIFAAKQIRLFSSLKGLEKEIFYGDTDGLEKLLKEFKELWLKESKQSELEEVTTALKTVAEEILKNHKKQ